MVQTTHRLGVSVPPPSPKPSEGNRPQSHGHVRDEALNITEHACTLWHLVAWCGMMSFFVVHLVMGLMSGIYWLVVELAGVGGCRTLDAPRPFLFY